MDEHLTVIAAAISDRGLSEKRPVNEDSYIASLEHGIFAVADGVGGAQAGDVASQMAVEIIGEAFVNLTIEADPEDTMKLALERANEAIFHMSHDLPQLSSMATTVVALHLAREVATIAHVGDSRLYRLDPSGQLHRETADHSVVEEEVRAGRMTPEQAANHPSRNVISRALGAESTVDIDLKMQIVKPGTKFLLCSDGVTRHIDDWELAALLSSEDSPEDICGQIRGICYDRGAEDNLTAIVVFSPLAEAEFQTAPLVYPHSETIVEEEVTIAGSRPVDEHESSTTSGSGLLDEPPQIAVPLAKGDDSEDNEAYLLENAEEIYADEPQPDETYTSSSVIVPAEHTDPPVVTRSERSETFASDLHGEPEMGSFTGRILSSLVLLVVGSLLGMAAFYFLLRTEPIVVQQPPPVLTEQKSNNVPLTSFEEGRRLVDKNPAAYIQANAASPQTSEEYFLLGRAFFLSGKQWEAKRAFTEAKNRLSQADPLNAATLANEIGMALAIIDSPSAAEAMQKDITSRAAANSGTPNGAAGEPSPTPAS